MSVMPQTSSRLTVQDDVGQDVILKAAVERGRAETKADMGLFYHHDEAAQARYPPTLCSHAARLLSSCAHNAAS